MNDQGIMLRFIIEPKYILKNMLHTIDSSFQEGGNIWELI